MTVILSVAGVVHGQFSGDSDLTWSTTSTGADFALQTIVGAPEYATTTAQNIVFLPGFLAVTVDLPAAGKGEGEGSDEEFARDLLDRVNEFDTDGDGLLSRDEVLAAFPDSSAILDRIDTNGDGMLSQAELNAAAGGNLPPGCQCAKSGSLTDIQRYVGDLFLLGAALLALFAMPGCRTR